MERNDAVIERMLATEETAIDTEAGLSRFAERARSVRGPERRPWLRPLAAAAVIALVFAGAAATGAADTIVTIFQPKKVAPVTVQVTDVSGLPDLSAYGTVTWKTRPEQRQAPTIEAAEAATGLRALRPATSPGADERVYTISRGEASFAFDEAKLRASADRVQRTPPPMPASIASSTLTVTGGPAMVRSWGGSFDAAKAGSSMPRLVIAQSRAPVVTSNGATVDELRDYALAQPGLSPSLAQQIRAIGDPSQTLLVPVPIDLASGRAVTVRGVQGVLVGDSTGLGSALF
ncbi:MAG TPA: hypothetical protein VFM93_05385, partial [Candidatus Limnocylindria bacterium]|nr:hypothetical protein [Candidatus Limnocylindria bacterium]